MIGRWVVSPVAGRSSYTYTDVIHFYRRYVTLGTYSAREVKSVLCSHLRQKWIDLCQTNAKITTGPVYTYCRIHFASVTFALTLDRVIRRTVVYHSSTSTYIYQISFKLEKLFVETPDEHRDRLYGVDS